MNEIRPIVDMWGSLPTATRIAQEIRSWGAEPGYRQVFGPRWSKVLGLPTEAIEQIATLDATSFFRDAQSILTPLLPTTDECVRWIRDAGIVKMVLHGTLITDVPMSNDVTAELVEAEPELFVGFARIDPTSANSPAEIERCARMGLRGITVTPFWHGVACDDPSLRDILEAAQKNQMILWVHTSMNWKRTTPLDLEHPRHVDAIAGQYRDLNIVCGHGGWPWINDMVAIAWRHRNVFIDISGFRPKHVFVPGSGWDTLAYYGDRTIADRLLWGSTWTLLGLTPAQLAEEAWRAPWSEETKTKWMHDNGMRLLGEAAP